MVAGADVGLLVCAGRGGVGFRKKATRTKEKGKCIRGREQPVTQKKVTNIDCSLYRMIEQTGLKI